MFSQSLRSRLRDCYALLSSMRFAIGLLLVVALASMIGTLLPQNEAKAVYVAQLGLRGAELAMALQFNAVYSAWWFLLILAFLVLSTSLCVARNAPKYLRDMQRYKESVRLGSLRAMPLHLELPLQADPHACLAHVQQHLQARQWRVRLQQRGPDQVSDVPRQDVGVMVAARKGVANKLGYIATHSAIVLICLGGLIDSGVWARMQVWLGWKEPLAGISGAERAAAQPVNILSAATPSYRASLIVAEGQRSGMAILPQSQGFLLQELPFSLELQRFEVDYYATGMPRLFASEVIVHDRATGQSRAERIEVNRPLRVDGIDIFQASFADGGSSVQLMPLMLRAAHQGPGTHACLLAVVGQSMALPVSTGLAGFELDVTDLRLMNVEDLSDTAASSSSPFDTLGPEGLSRRLQNQLQQAHRIRRDSQLRNVGPSVDYVLRDRAGQALAFRNFMQAVDLGDGVPVYLLGVRKLNAPEFAYWRVPQDAQGSMDGFLSLLQAINDPQRLQAAIHAYVAGSASAQPGAASTPNEPAVNSQSEPEAGQQRLLFASQIMAIFLGQTAQAPATQADEAAQVVGMAAVDAFLSEQVLPEQQSRARDVVTRILRGIVWQLLQQLRLEQGLPVLEEDAAANQLFVQQALLALDQAFYYPVPLVLVLTGFEPVQASVFEVSKAPGRYLVYSGALALVLGVFAMLFVRERRLWIWLGHAARQAVDPVQDQAKNQMIVLMALSSNRHTLDAEQEFKDLVQGLFGQADGLAAPSLQAIVPGRHDVTMEGKQ